MKVKKIMMISVMLISVLFLNACTNGNNAETIKTSGDEVSENTSTYYNSYLGTDPTSLDISLRSDSYSSSIITNVMEGLVRLEERDGEYFMAPGDAMSWEANEAGTVWTFHLGDNKWSDGVPVTADQYVYSLRRSADPATGCPNAWFIKPLLNYDAISKGEMSTDALGIEAIDEKTLQITLTHANPAFIEMCNGTVYYPLRQDKIEEWGEKFGTEPEYTIYNGPFVLDSWIHNSKLVLKKNPEYWDFENVKLDTVTFNIMSDTATVVNAYKAGDLDSLGVATQEWLEEFKLDESSVYDATTLQGITYAFHNTEDPLLQNKNIRKALTLAIDQEDINEMCFGGLRIPTYGWVVPTISVGDTKFRDYAGDPLLEMKEAMNDKGETAKDYLLKGMEELGLGNDPSTLDITYSLAGTNEWFRTMGEYLQQVYLDELGIELKIDFSEWGIFYENVQNGNYQLGFMSWGAYYNDPYDVLSIFYSDLDQVETGWSNAEFDELLNSGSIEMDPSKRLKYYADAEKLLLDDFVVCPMATSTSHTFYKDYVKGYSSLGFSSEGFKYIDTSGR